jgi:hypothetical protein
MDRLMLSPGGFFFDTEDSLSEGKEEDGTVEASSGSRAIGLVEELGR